jgi:hypothetical protein
MPPIDAADSTSPGSTSIDLVPHIVRQVDAAFSRAFRKALGTPPGVWRKRYAGGAAPV